MQKVILAVIVAVATSLATATTLAATVPTPIITGTDANSVSLAWSGVEGAAGYVVEYGITSGNYTADATATGETLTLSGLQNGSTYYMVLIPTDADGLDFDGTSEEISVEIGATSTSFALTEVVAMDSKNVIATFSANLSNDPITAKLIKSSDASDVSIANITKDATNPKQVTITTTDSLDPSTTYRLTIINARGEDGTIIKSGIDAFKEFPTTEDLPTVTGDATVTPAVIPPAPLMERDLNAAPENEAIVAETTTLEAVAAEAETLPETGPTETLLMIMAMLIAAGIMTLRKRLA